MAVRPITESLGWTPSCVVRNLDQRYVTGTIENTPLMLASSRMILNIDQDRNDETRYVENFEDGDFPALRPNCDRQAHAHHNHVALFVKILKKNFEYFKAVNTNCSWDTVQNKKKSTKKCDAKMPRLFLTKNLHSCQITVQAIERRKEMLSALRRFPFLLLFLTFLSWKSFNLGQIGYFSHFLTSRVLLKKNFCRCTSAGKWFKQRKVD